MNTARPREPFLNPNKFARLEFSTGRTDMNEIERPANSRVKVNIYLNGYYITSFMREPNGEF